MSGGQLAVLATARATGMTQLCSHVCLPPSAGPVSDNGTVLKESQPLVTSPFQAFALSDGCQVMDPNKTDG